MCELLRISNNILSKYSKYSNYRMSTPEAPAVNKA